ncbi:MAG: sensor histidine kinase [Opitutaceae bacterium]|nr:sensor histidine kinase [Opitutaceae bacterium]
MSPEHPAGAAPGPAPTHYAPAERASPETLARQVVTASHNAVIDALISTVHGLLAVLNEQRQVLAINEQMLRLIGVDDPARVLGLRVGEALQCIHAGTTPGGCGTTEYCSTCGAAVAQVTSLLENRPVETLCALTAQRAGVETSFCLRVRATPFELGGWRVLLIFLQDVTDWQQRAALERAFFHDLRNTLTALHGTNELLRRSVEGGGEVAELAADAVRLCRRLASEVDLQRCLSEANMSSYAAAHARHAVEDLLGELRTISLHHPAAHGRTIEILPAPAGLRVTTDDTVLLRVVCNMVVNALEATPAGGVIRVWVEIHHGHVAFCVWNCGEIPASVARRVFQRNFSTKEGTGRGMGTYAMKLLGEQCLKGSVEFTTGSASGTCFRLAVPADGHDAAGTP